MKKIATYYFLKTAEYISSKLWSGIWTAVGFIIVMKATGVFIVLTSK